MAGAIANYYEYEDITKEIKGEELEIADKQTAVKMMAKLDNLQARIEDLSDYKSEKVRLLNEKLDKLKNEAEVIREGLESFIVDHNDGENLSYPDVGTAYVSQKTKISVSDNEAAMNYLESLPEEEKNEMIRVKKSIKKRNFKEYAKNRLQSTGMLLPGTEQVEKKTFVYRSPRS